MEIWEQVYNPLGNIWLSAFVASLPILLFFASLVLFKLKGWVAAALTVGLSCIIAIAMYGMPIQSVLSSFVYGFITGMWPIAWIILAAIFLYKLSVKSGYFETLKHSVMSITPDHRIQVILIAFCFGAFLEGAIGFGGPVAITAALLMGLGLRPLYAAGLCMIANTAPVAFGAVGIPIIAMGKAVGVDPVHISAMVAHMLPPITIFVPFFIVYLMDGFKGVKETYPAILVASLTFAITQFVTASYVGPELPDITSAVVSLVCTTAFLKIWKPKNIFRVEGSEPYVENEQMSAKLVIKAWLPFVFLILTVVLWTMPFFKALFAKGGALSFTTFQFTVPFINEINQVAPIIKEGQNAALSGVFSVPLILTAGTAILAAAFLTVAAYKLKTSMIKEAATETIKEMSIPILTIGLVVAYAYVAKNSAQAATMGLALSNTGQAFAFFSPVIGWLGVFLTGSDTSSNLLFGPLQQVTAQQLGVQDYVFLAANTVGGVVGKMISPQSIAIACAAVGLVGQESSLFRFTLKYSIFFIIIAGIISWSIVHIVPSLIPLF
ncbi:lactate permease LctP family transporter [Campylobacter geochelonis]|uniref:L-lactate permease n=1 Tax=Campylobacter geochelonis TaxID=1780362 RepID=A0A128EK67_9BACT|nr:lactate permease LctP family transporter [Campylobacter geochelonis]QKF71651.1 L-lactate permease [Campylobacter geochelonis]CZE49274.1 L-lactate permease [Campylobacter geochelonis]CZE51481.1 L-lactate permease [Campylobacter geochelonis]